MNRDIIPRIPRQVPLIGAPQPAVCGNRIGENGQRCGGKAFLVTPVQAVFVQGHKMGFGPPVSFMIACAQCGAILNLKEKDDARDPLGDSP